MTTKPPDLFFKKSKTKALLLYHFLLFCVPKKFLEGISYNITPVMFTSSTFNKGLAASFNVASAGFSLPVFSGGIESIAEYRMLPAA